MTLPDEPAKVPESGPQGKQAAAPLARGRGQRHRRKKKTADEGSTPAVTTATPNPALFLNRELSWLEFNQRVLEEAKDARHPLLERVKFLSIVSSNLDEFFMIRVGPIREQRSAEVTERTIDGATPAQQLAAIHERVSWMLDEMSDCFWKDLHPKLAAAGIHLLRWSQVEPAAREALAAVFARDIFPVLTPLAFDPGHPFPYISNLSLNLAVVVSTSSGEERFARVKVPDVLPRLVEVPGGDARAVRYVWLEDVIAANLHLLFPGLKVLESYVFHVTRNADIEIQEDEAEDLILTIEESIRLRRYGAAARVGIEKTMPARIRNILAENLEVTQDDVYTIVPPLGLSHLLSLLRLPRPELKDPPFVPAPLTLEEEADDLFARMRQGDFLLHHPYDSFAPVVQFIRQAARDPNVLAIKQTLYRIGKESPLIPLFIEAAESGKQVAVLVELKARFDEENNIGWAKQLEQAGIHVVYGLVGLKTHAKMALVVRREADGLRRYVHLGTGNYNPVTARVYTDLSLFTTREAITADASEVFNFLTGYSQREQFSRLAVAPINLRETVVARIDREIAHARTGTGGAIILKMNALTDPRMIEKLYEASQAGVTIDLIIRGICCLRPGLKGISENIRVRSIVGRFLEHSRAFYFGNAGEPEVFLSSADLMTRNLDRRVELMFPVDDHVLAEMVCREVLGLALQDNQQARILQSDGTYRRAEPGDAAVEMQARILHARGSAAPVRVPVPRESPERREG